MTRRVDTVSGTIATLITSVLLAGCAEQRYRGMGSIDRTRAFYYPGFAKRGNAELGKVAGIPIDAATYLRYLAGRFGTRYIEDLAFDMALERECRARGLARSAPVLARSTAAMRIKESGRSSGSDPDYTLQRKPAVTQCPAAARRGNTHGQPYQKQSTTAGRIPNESSLCSAITGHDGAPSLR